jgi:hypothetical protein
MAIYRYQNLDKPEEFTDVEVREGEPVFQELHSMRWDGPPLQKVLDDGRMVSVACQAFVSHQLIGRVE